MRPCVDQGLVCVRRGGRSRWMTRLLVVLAIAALLAPVDAAVAKPRHRHDVSPQIINGQPVDPGHDRFVVALLDRSRGTTQFEQQICGGSIIGGKYVLTAAHCVNDPAPPGSLAVLIDQVELDAGGLVIPVKHVKVDPKFDPDLFSNDAAVLTLAEKIPSGVGQRIALVDSGNQSLEQAGATASVAGWGDTNPDDHVNAYPTHLMQADVTIVSDDQCAAAYSGFDRASMVCAAGQAPPRDSCQGDSGGPLFANGDTANPTQIGIVSFGAGCAQAGFPGVYTQLSDPAIAKWIHGVTSKHRSKHHHR